MLFDESRSLFGFSKAMDSGAGAEEPWEKLKNKNYERQEVVNNWRIAGNAPPMRRAAMARNGEKRS